MSADEPFVFSGVSVDNPRFSMVVDEFGYSDSMLDRRGKFMGREYLSGDWAAAVYCEGGNLPAGTRMLPRRLVFPDFWTPLPHFISLYDPPFQVDPPNMYGYPVYKSAIANPDIEVRMTYETVDLGEDMGGRLAIGLTPHGEGGAGSYLSSGRYAFRQTYNITNISGRILSNVRFFQFIHTLHADRGVYDGRDYGGGLPEYRFGITLQGDSLGLNLRSLETVKHTDTLAMKYSRIPSGLELNHFGIKGVDSHEVGEPSGGVYHSVSTNSLSGTDAYDPDGTAWVAGAVSFDFGSLAPGATTSIDVLIGLKTTYTTELPPLELKVRNAFLANDLFTIDFREATDNPYVGFILRQSMRLDDPVPEWDQVAVPYQKDVPFPGWGRFQVPKNLMRQRFYAVEAIIPLDL